MDTTRFIIAGGMLDGTGAGLRRDIVLEIEDGIIVAIDEGRIPPPGAVVDCLPHCLVLPPLVDANVFLTRSPSIASPDGQDLSPLNARERAILVERHLGYCHAYGVLGLAVADHPAEVAPDWRRLGEDRGLLELRAAASLPREGTPGPAMRAGDGEFLRLHLSADIDIGPTNQQEPTQGLDRHLISRNGKKVIMVANGAEAVAEALAAGCDAIEQGYAMGEENLRKMAERGVLWIPSLVRAKNGVDGAGGGGDIACRFSQRYVAPGKPVPGAEAFWKRTLAEQLGQLRLARSLGVMTMLGSGAGNTGLLHGESLIEEMKLFVKAGYPLAEIFHAASEVAARFFKMSRLGRLAVGRPATFLLTRGTLQQLPRKLHYLEGIVVDGTPCPIYRKTPSKAVAGKS